MHKKTALFVFIICLILVGFALFFFMSRTNMTDLHSIRMASGSTSLCPNCNVVLISLDTCGAKHIGCYGYSKDTMPNLCTFGKENIFFENNYSNAPWTLPSHVSLFTGLSSRHKINTQYIDSLAADIPLLPQVLKNAGYTTSFYAPADAVNFPKDLVYNRGIDTWDTERVHDSGNFERAMTELNVNVAAGKKSFIFFHTYVCHNYMDDDNAYLSPDGTHSIDRTNTDQLNYIKSLYEARMHMLDATLIPAVHSAILDTPLKNNTVVIMMADHGEEFMEHGELNHTTLYDFNMKVPLVMYVPHLQSKDIADNVQNVDIFPTILDLVGIPNTYSTDGISLVPLIQGASLKHRLLFVESGVKTLRQDDWKLFLVRNRDTKTLIPYELYNTRSDPDEKQNVLPAHFDIANDMIEHAVTGKLFTY